jgi:hypothetical protein
MDVQQSRKVFLQLHKQGLDGVETSSPWRTVTFEHAGFDFTDNHTQEVFWTPGNCRLLPRRRLLRSCPPDHQSEMLHYFVNFLILGTQAGLDWKCDPDTLAQIQAEQIQMQINWVRVRQAPCVPVK